MTRLSGLLADAQKIIAEYKASTIAAARDGLAQASPERLSAEEMRTLESLANCMGFGRTVSALNHALEILRGSQVTSASRGTET